MLTIEQRYRKLRDATAKQMAAEGPRVNLSRPVRNALARKAELLTELAEIKKFLALSEKFK